MKSHRYLPLALCLCSAALLLVASAEAQQLRRTRDGLRHPVYRVALGNDTARTAEKPDHPLAPMVNKAEKMLANMRKKVKDYSATLVKRERVDGVLNGHQYIHVKIRQEQTNGRGEVTEPFSVYMNFLAPDDLKGREVLWVKGHNGGKLIAHDGGTGLIAALKSAVTVELEPDAPLAMRGNKYPITEVGIENLLTKLIERASEDFDHEEIEVKTFNGTKINDRVCTCLQTVHPVERDHFRYHIARIYVDDELQLPIRYEAYGWPTRQGEKPPLLEEYTYLNLRLNNGFTDRDFDRNNPNYNFN